MEKILISNYVEVIKELQGYILFNKLNGTIVKMENQQVEIEDKNIWVTNVDKNEKNFLMKNQFMVDDCIVRNKIKELDKPCVDMITIVTLSVTEECNLHCKYCYQNMWNRRQCISQKSYMQIIIKYLKKILPSINSINGTLAIKFIGGEPLIKKNLIIEIKNKVEDLVKNYYQNVELKYLIDTNMTLITKDFIQSFPNLTITTTVTSKGDHDKLRDNSYDKVISKLKEVKTCFENKNYILQIRYNVNHENCVDFESTIDYLERIGLIFKVEVQNIYNSDNSFYENQLTENEFEDFYINEVVPFLIRHNRKVKILPSYGLSRQCRVQSVYDRKIYSNGQIVLCDSFPKKDNFNEFVCPLEHIEKMCLECYDFPYCGGHKPCDAIRCNGKYRRKKIEINRIKKYVEINNID